MTTARADLNYDEIRRALDAERAEILGASEGSSEDRRPVELDQQSVGRLSRMDAMQMQAMAQAVDRRRRSRLALIEAAIRRFEDGSYGACVECGEDIPARRLTADPATTRCVDCAA